MRFGNNGRVIKRVGVARACYGNWTLNMGKIWQSAGGGGENLGREGEFEVLGCLLFKGICGGSHRTMKKPLSCFCNDKIRDFPGLRIKNEIARYFLDYLCIYLHSA